MIWNVKLPTKNFEDKHIKIGDTVYYIDYREKLHNIPAVVISHNNGKTTPDIDTLNVNVKVYRLNFKDIGIKNIPYYSIITKEKYFKRELDKTLRKSK